MSSSSRQRAIRKHRVFIPFFLRGCAFVILCTQTCLANEDCSHELNNKIKSTLGAEIEFQPVRANSERKNVPPLVEFMAYPLSREEADFERMTLGKLFGLYGRDTHTGEMIEGLLPPIIVESRTFQERLSRPPLKPPDFAQNPQHEWLPSEREEYYRLRKEYDAKGFPFELKQVGNQYFIVNFESLKGNRLRRTLQLLFDIAGSHNPDFVLAKRPSSWLDKTNRWDQLIPDQIVIESRGGKSAGLEFPMNGPVNSRKEIFEYIKNLWIRLGLFEESETQLVEDAAALTDIHLHWVPKISSARAGLRKTLYTRMIGIFGDENDKGLIKDLSHLSQSLRNAPKNTNALEGIVADVFDKFIKTFQQTPIQILTRTVFRTLVATEEGVYQNGRILSEVDQDPNFTNHLKLLRFGFRGKYGQATIPANVPVPIVGIEVRNSGSFINTMDQAAQIEKDFHREVLPGERGLVDHPIELIKQARLYNIDERLMEMFEHACQAGNPKLAQSKWHRTRIMAMFLLPLTPWENHPLVVKKSANLGVVGSETIRKKIQAARNRYAEKINSLVKSYYQDLETLSASDIDWLTSDPQKQFKTDKPETIGQLNNIKVNGKEEILQMTMVVEMLRFLSYSGLDDYLQ